MFKSAKQFLLFRRFSIKLLCRIFGYWPSIPIFSLFLLFNLGPSALAQEKVASLHPPPDLVWQRMVETRYSKLKRLNSSRLPPRTAAGIVPGSRLCGLQQRSRLAVY